MARQNGKKKASPKRIVLTFTDSPFDQAVYAALQKESRQEGVARPPRLVKYYLRNVFGLHLPDRGMLKRMGLADVHANIYGLPDGHPRKVMLQNQLQLKTTVKALDEMGLLTKKIQARILADSYRRMLLEDEGGEPPSARPKTNKRVA